MANTPFLTPPAIAAQLGVTPETVRGWIVAGQLRAVNLASRGCRRPRYRIAPEWLDDFLASRTVTPPPKRTRRRRAKPAHEYF